MLRLMRKSLSLALALILTAGVFTFAPGEAKALEIQSGAPTLTLNSLTQTVMFAGQEWYMVGDGTNGIYKTWQGAPVNSVTLLLKGGNPYSDTTFVDTNPYLSFYKDSTLQIRMEALASDSSLFPAKELAIISARTLRASDDTNFRIMGGDVANQKLWPLSYDELSSIRSASNGSTVTSFGKHFWLRSPDGLSAYVGYQDGSGSVSFSTNTFYYAIRPAFNMNLSSVLFTSDASAASGKSFASAGGGLVGVTAPTGPVKLTFSDSAMATPTLTFAGTTNGTGTIGFGYTGAETGTNQYLSCTLEQIGAVKYYGKLANCASNAGGSFVLPLSGVAAGSYDLKIFCEQANDDTHSDFAGTPVALSLVVNASVGSVTGATEDNTSPTVFSVTPSGAGANINGNIVVTFSESMNQTAGIGSVALNGGAALIGGAWTNSTTYSIPYSGLSYISTYNIAISGFKDAAGNTMAPDSTHSFTTVAAPLPPIPSGGNWNPPPPPSPVVPKTAFPCDATALNRIKVYENETLRGKVLTTIGKEDALVILAIASNGRAFDVMVGGGDAEDVKRGSIGSGRIEGYVAFKDIAATFGAPIKATAIKKGYVYVKQESGKLKRDGYFPKDTVLTIYGISGKYLENKRSNITYWLDAAQWRLWVPED